MQAFNRTSLELKLPDFVNGGTLLPNPFNRTSLELKHRRPLGKVDFEPLLIAPVWN